MTNVKLSQIASGGAVNTSTDTAVAVRSGTTDVLITLGALTSITPGTGVSTFLTTPSSANLAAAITDETGTGALVFANSPTLISPVLGTPASGVATNLTGTAAGLTAGHVSGNPNLRPVGAGSGVPGGGTVVATGVVQYVQVPYTGTITGFAIIGDQSGSIVVDVWKTNASAPTVANTITASAKPTLSSSQYINSTTLTGWTTSVAANDVFGFHVDSATTLNSFCIVIFITTN